jgi:chromosome segregation ATPase
MFEGTAENFLFIVFGAFMLGWMVAKFGVWVSNRTRKVTRDPRDDRIRSLEADHRVAKTDSTKAIEENATLKQEFQAAEDAIKVFEKLKAEQGNKITQLRKDLKDSVKKTRELRAELSDRATENVKSEVKLREVETELEVTRATTDLVATGVLDYSMAPDDDEDGAGNVKITKVAT